MAAGAPGDSGDRIQESHEPRECMACRGTGSVISHLGGIESRVQCPWCGGGGIRVPGLDAQAHWEQHEGEEPGQETTPDRAGEAGSGAASESSEGS